MAPGGYAWWYVDALSDDGEHGLTIIAFVGSVFSPYYAWSGRRRPEDHCAINVALYHRRHGRWAMTERSRRSLFRTAVSFRAGPSALRWTGDGLVIDIDELAAPLPRRLTGRVRLHPAALTDRFIELHPRHRWWPIAPRARVEAEFTHPSTRWSGEGYLDTNWGAAALEADFVDWTWARAPHEDGAAVVYDALPRGAPPARVALCFDGAGVAEPFEAPPFRPLPGTRWQIPRAARSETPPVLRRTLEDTPFYARSEVQARLLGRTVVGVHESLSLDRFGSRWVKALLPFRMPRRG